MANSVKLFFTLAFMIGLWACSPVPRATITKRPCLMKGDFMESPKVHVNSKAFVLDRRNTCIEVNPAGTIDTFYYPYSRYKEPLFTDFATRQKLQIKECSELPVFYVKDKSTGTITVRNTSKQAFRIHCHNNDIFKMLEPGESYTLTVKANPVNLAFTTQKELEQRGQGMDFRGRVKYEKMIRFICHSGIRFEVTRGAPEQYSVVLKTE